MPAYRVTYMCVHIYVHMFWYILTTCVCVLHKYIPDTHIDTHQKFVPLHLSWTTCCRLAFYSPFPLPHHKISFKLSPRLSAFPQLPSSILTVLLPYHPLFQKRCLAGCNQVAWCCPASSSAHSDAYRATVPTSINRQTDGQVGLHPHQH